MSHHTLKTYSTKKGVPICLHENKFFKMMFNGYFHYLEPVRYWEAVATVPVFENGDLLMVRLRRAPAIGFSLEFPRGGVDAGEGTATAAARELAEETGYHISADQVRYLGKLGADTATLNNTMDVYSVIIPETVLQGKFDTEEIEVPVRVTQKEFFELVQTGGIVDGITLASWSMAYIAQAIQS